MVTEKRAWAEIDLNAIENNIREIRSFVDDGVKIMGVVKADGYGHGYLETARTLIENGADCLAVAVLDEAIQLRKCGIDVPVLILGYTPPKYAEELIINNIMPNCYTYELAEAMSKAGQKFNKTGKIHIKIDTGMGRVGYRYNDDENTNSETVDEIIRISKLPFLEINGMFTHFSVADEDDDEYTSCQFRRFSEVCDRVKNAGINVKLCHCCNSAGLMRFPEYHMDMVRPGIILYGLKPGEFVPDGILDLKPAMSLKAQVTNIKHVGRGTSISYGRKFRSEADDTVIATIPIGYADGYSRILSGKVQMIAGGKKCNQIGNICMDQCMINVTSANNIRIGDEVILFGSDGKNDIPIETIAEIMGTINYEILCVIGKRIPRVYLRDGRIADVHNYLLDNPISE